MNRLSQTWLLAGSALAVIVALIMVASPFEDASAARREADLGQAAEQRALSEFHALSQTRSIADLFPLHR